MKLNKKFLYGIMFVLIISAVVYFTLNNKPLLDINDLYGSIVMPIPYSFSGVNGGTGFYSIKEKQFIQGTSENINSVSYNKEKYKWGRFLRLDTFKLADEKATVIYG